MQRRMSTSQGARTQGRLFFRYILSPFFLLGYGSCRFHHRSSRQKPFGFRSYRIFLQRNSLFRLYVCVCFAPRPKKRRNEPKRKKKNVAIAKSWKNFSVSLKKAADKEAKSGVGEWSPTRAGRNRSAFILRLVERSLSSSSLSGG